MDGWQGTSLPRLVCSVRWHPACEASYHTHVCVRTCVCARALIRCTQPGDGINALIAATKGSTAATVRAILEHDKSLLNEASVSRS